MKITKRQLRRLIQEAVGNPRNLIHILLELGTLVGDLYRDPEDDRDTDRRDWNVTYDVRGYVDVTSFCEIEKSFANPGTRAGIKHRNLTFNPSTFFYSELPKLLEYAIKEAQGKDFKSRTPKITKLADRLSLLAKRMLECDNCFDSRGNPVSGMSPSINPVTQLYSVAKPLEPQSFIKFHKIAYELSQNFSTNNYWYNTLDEVAKERLRRILEM